MLERIMNRINMVFYAYYIGRFLASNRGIINKYEQILGKSTKWENYSSNKSVFDYKQIVFVGAKNKSFSMKKHNQNGNFSPFGWVFCAREDDFCEINCNFDNSLI